MSCSWWKLIFGRKMAPGYFLTEIPRGKPLIISVTMQELIVFFASSLDTVDFAFAQFAMCLTTAEIYLQVIGKLNKVKTENLNSEVVVMGNRIHRSV